MQIAKKSSLSLRLRCKKYKNRINFFDIFVSLLIKRGLKKKAKLIVCNFICYLKKYFFNKNYLFQNNFYRGFEKLFEIYKPRVLLIYKKIAAKVYLIPWYINENKARILLIKWFIDSAKKRIEKNLSLKLYFEFIDLFNGQGLTVKKLEDYYKIVKDNRAFVKFLYTRKRVFRSRVKKFSG